MGSSTRVFSKREREKTSFIPLCQQTTIEKDLIVSPLDLVLSDTHTHTRASNVLRITAAVTVRTLFRLVADAEEQLIFSSRSQIKGPPSCRTLSDPHKTGVPYSLCYVPACNLLSYFATRGALLPAHTISLGCTYSAEPPSSTGLTHSADQTITGS